VGKTSKATLDGTLAVPRLHQRRRRDGDGATVGACARRALAVQKFNAGAFVLASGGGLGQTPSPHGAGP